MADLEVCPRYAQFSKSTPSHVPDRFLLVHLINKPQFPHTNSPDWLPWILVVFDWTTASLSVGACLECREASTFDKDRQTDRLTDRQSYGFMADKPAPSSNESQANGTRHLSHWLKEEGWGKSPIWCIQDGPRFRHYTNCWHRQRDGAPCCLLP